MQINRKSKDNSANIVDDEQEGAKGEKKKTFVFLQPIIVIV